MKTKRERLFEPEINSNQSSLGGWTGGDSWFPSHGVMAQSCGIAMCECLIDKSQAVSISPTIAQNSMACLYFKEKIEIGKIRKCTMGGKIKKWID